MNKPKTPLENKSYYGGITISFFMARNPKTQANNGALLSYFNGET